MTTTDSHGTSRDPAAVYEECFVPALFGPWARRIAEAAGIRPGERVLDVACGTGVLARAAAHRASPGGTVTGVDINQGMLAVARRIAPEIDWCSGRAEALPFESRVFDVVVSQFGVMFFADRIAAAGEMLRVLRPGGRLAAAVWDGLERIPAYLEIVDMLRQHFDEQTANLLRVPFSLGSAEELGSLFAGAGAGGIRIQTQRDKGRFASIRSWMSTDIRGWIEFSRPVSDAELEALVRDAEKRLASFITPGGAVEFEMQAHVLTGNRP
jgi:SAM-dependent methyltransferase